MTFVLETTARAAFWIVLLVAAARVGAWITGSRATGLAHLAWDGATGLTALIAVWLVVGSFPGGFAMVPILIVAGSVVIAAAVRCARDPVARFGGRTRPGGAGVAAAIVLASVAAAGLFWDRVPPVFYDTLAYHFAQPDLWLVQGRIAPAAWSVHSWFPPGMSVLYGVGLSVGGVPLANDANLLVALILVALVADVGTRIRDAATGTAAAATLASLPIFGHAVAIPAADLAHGTFGFGALAAILTSRLGDSGESPATWRRRAGWLAGGALLTKYLGFAVPLAAGALWIVLMPPRGAEGANWPARLRAAFPFVAIAIALVAPWLVADAAAVGNPVAPVLSGVFPVSGLAPGAYDILRVDMRGGFPSLRDLRGSFRGLITGDPDAERLYPGPAWGWLPLILLGALPLAGGGDSRRRWVLALAGGLLAFWVVSFRWERFLVAASAFLCLAMADAAVTLWRRGSVRRLVVAGAALVAVLTVVRTGISVQRFTGGWEVAVGRVSSESHLERAWPAIQLYRRLATHANGTASRVLLVGEGRHYGLEIPRVAPTEFNVHPLAALIQAGVPPAEIPLRLRAQGFTHVIVDPGRARRSAAKYPSLAVIGDEPEALEEFVRALGAPIVADRDAAAYELPATR